VVLNINYHQDLKIRVLTGRQNMLSLITITKGIHLDEALVKIRDLTAVPVIYPPSGLS
jgi:hypothetical protein